MIVKGWRLHVPAFSPPNWVTPLLNLSTSEVFWNPLIQQLTTVSWFLMVVPEVTKNASKEHVWIVTKPVFSCFLSVLGRWARGQIQELKVDPPLDVR